MATLNGCLKVPFFKSAIATPVLCAYGYHVANYMSRFIYPINPVMGAIAGGSAAILHGVLFEGTKPEHSTTSLSPIAKIKLVATAILTYLATLSISAMYKIPFTPEAFLYLGAGSLISAAIIGATAIIFIAFSKKLIH